jgi:transposase-like protein
MITFTAAQLKKICYLYNNGNTLNFIATEVGVSKTRIKAELSKLGIYRAKILGVKLPWSKEQVEEAVRKSYGLHKTGRILSKDVTKNQIRNISRFIKQNGIDTSHWPLNHVRSSIGCKIRHYKPDTEIFRAGRRYTAIVRERFRQINPPNGCSVCTTKEWCGKLLDLHLDHIDGDTTNNLATNLRWICPNCHSQTPTFNVGTRMRVQVNSDRILSLYKNTSISKIAEILGITQYIVKKHLTLLGALGE